MDEQSLHTDTVHDWITGYLTNSLTPEEMQSFQEWLNASEENRKGNYIQSYSLKPLKGCKFSN